MSFEATDIIPIEYQAIFNIISPIEKSGILKIIKEDLKEVEGDYEKYLLGLKTYLEKYKGEDISPIVFIMFGQIATDIQKDNLILDLLKIYPNSPELKFYKIQQDVDKGIFDNIDEVLKLTRLNDSERNQILTRLVAADKLSKIIMDLQSFALEVMYHTLREKFEEIPTIYEKVDAIWKRVVEWVKKKEITYVIEIAIRLILQQTQFLMSAQNLNDAIAFFEKPVNKEVLDMAQSAVMKANVLHVASMLYYQAGKPNKAIGLLEDAIDLHDKIHGRNSWKSSFYHNLAYMYTLVDTDKCIEVYQKCLDLVEGTEDYQSITTTLSNIIGLYQQQNKKAEARKYLMRLVELLENSPELVTPFRAYAVSSNALSLDEYQLANKYLQKLEAKVNEQPTLFNKAILSGAKMAYNLDAVVNSEQAYQWGERSLYYFNKQKDYLNALGSLFNLTSLDLEFYKITWKDRYINTARKRFNELFTLIGALDLPEFQINKNLTLAGYEILTKNFDQAENYLIKAPEIKNEAIESNVKMMKQMLEFAKKQSTREEGQPPVKISDEPIINELANNKDALNMFTMHLMEKTLQELVQLPQQVDPIKADIKLLLLINSAGLTIYTKIIDVHKMDQQLISNFISAIDSFGEQLFGTKEPYFSFKRGDNTILFQNINEDLNIAIIVAQENYDSIMKMNTLAKEINDYTIEQKPELSKTLDEKSKLFKWLEEKISEILN